MKTRSCERVFGFYEDIRRLTRHCETDNGIVAPPARHCETDNGTVTPSVRHCGFNNDRITDLSPHCSSHNDPAAILFDHLNKKPDTSHAPGLILIKLYYLFLCFWEFNSKSRADSFCTFYIDFTFVGFDQVFD